MADWKVLNDLDGRRVDVNLDNVAYMQELRDGETYICFAGGSRGEIALGVTVREKVKDIRGSITSSHAK